MRAHVLIGLAALAVVGGCSQDEYARRLLVQDPTNGRIALASKGTGEQLKSHKSIDDYRVVAAPDKTPIDVWIMHPRPQGSAAKGTVVILHGLNESKASFPFFGAGERLAKMGYNVVLPDLRAHGRSGGQFMTYGAKEKQDTKAVMDTLLADKSVCEPFYVVGSTLGGSVAIQYAAIDPRVKGVMAFAPYKDFRSIAAWMTLNPLLYPPGMTNEQLSAIVAHAAAMGKFELSDTSALDAVKKLNCPLLVVHGMLDLQVPMDHSDAICKAYQGPKKLVLVTPGPEQVAMAAILEDWIAEQVNKLATGKLEMTGAASPPAK